MMKYAHRAMAVIAAVAAISMGAVGAVSASPVSRHAPDAQCGLQESQNIYSYGSFAANDVNIRTGPSTSCTSVGLGYIGHSVIIYCYSGDWDYLDDQTTGKLGWSLDEYVDWNTGAPNPC